MIEYNGVGKRLHDHVLNWYFDNPKEKTWLSTSPGTRDENFYLPRACTPKGTYPNNEVLFELQKGEWIRWKKNRGL